MSRAVGGATLVETLVALLLGLFVLQAGMAAVAGTRSAHARTMERADALSAVRYTGALLRAETAAGRAGVDWVVADDSLALRAYRGTGLVCGEHEAPETLVVSYGGYRRPDPAKDSVEVVHADGARAVLALTGLAAGPPTCWGMPLEGSLALELDGPVPPGGVVARVFERGAYSLSARALRYRRGAGGRQPLTPEILERESGWRVADGRLSAELVWRVGADPLAASSARPEQLRWWRVPLGRGAP
jgi:hypothetical protein